MSAVVKAGKKVVGAVGDVFEFVGDAVTDVVDFAVDEIIEPAVNFVGDTIDAMMDDPLKTIATVTAIATGNAWAIPLIDGASVAMNGGDLGDVLTTIAKSYVAQQIGAEVGDYVGEAVGDAGIFESAVANEIFTDAVTEGAVGASYAVIYGQDPFEAFLTGGLTSAVSAGMGKIGEELGWDYTDPKTGTSKPIPATLQNIIGASIAAELSGQEINGELLAGAVARGLITTSMVKDLGEMGGINFEDPKALAYTTAAIQRVAGIALSGGSGEDAWKVIDATMSAYGKQALNEVIKDSDVGDFIGNTLDKISGDYQKVQGIADDIDEVALRRQKDAESYEKMRTELKDKYDAIEADKAKIDKLPKNTEADQTAYNKAVKALNDKIADFNSLYNDYNPKMDALEKSINADTATLDTLQSNLTDAQAKLQVSTERLDDDLKPLYDDVAKSFAMTMDPLINEDEYRELNGLGADENVYEHFIANAGEGNVYTNKDQYYTAYQQNLNAALDAVIDQTNITASGVSAAEMKALSDILGDMTPQELADFVLDQEAVMTLGSQFTDLIVDNAKYDYRDATLDEETTSRLESLGFDTSDGMYGEPLTVEERAALIADDNKGINTVQLEEGTTYADIASGNATIVVNDNGERVYRNVVTTQEVWDPQYGRVTKTTTYDAAGREYSVTTTDANGNTVGPLVIHIYGGNTAADDAALLTDIVVSGDATAIQAAKEMGFTDMTIDVTTKMLDWAKENGYDNVQDTLANVMKATGGILESLNGVSALFGVAPPDTALGQFAAALVKVGESGNTEEYKANLKELQTKMSSSKFKDLRKKALMATGMSEEEATNIANQEYAELPWYDKAIDKMQALGGAIADHKTTFLAEYIGVEAMQELAPLAIGGVATLGAKGAALAAGKELSQRIATRAGLSAAATTDLAESFGGTAAEAYDRGLQTALKSGMSQEEAQKYAMDLAVRSGAVAVTATAVTLGVGGLALEKALLNKENVSGFLAKGVTELASRVAKGGKITLKEGVTESIEEGLASGYMAGQLYQLDDTIDVTDEIIGSAYMGFIVGGSVSGTAYGVAQTGDAYSNVISSLNPAVKAAIDTGKATAVATALTASGVTDNITVSNVMNQVDNVNYTSSAEAISAFDNRANTAYVPSQADIDAMVGKVPDANIQKLVDQRIDQNYFDVDEVKAAAAQEGITLTTEQATKYIGQVLESTATSNLRSELDPTYTTYDESKQMFTDLGFTPTKAEIEKFIGEKAEADQITAVGEYVDPLYTDFDEAKAWLEEQGYTPTDKEVQNFVGQVEETQQQQAITEWADPRVVSEDEVIAAYQALGIKEPTEDDINGLVGQYMESELAGKAEANLPAARYNSIINALDDLGLDIDATEEALLTKMGEYEDAGIARDEALQEAIGDVSEQLGITEENLLNQLGTTEENLLNQLGTTEENLLNQLAETESTLATDIENVSEQLGITEENLLNQLAETESTLATDIENVSNLVGKPQQEVTQADIDFLADIIAQNEVLTEQQLALYDVTGDGQITIDDQTLLEQLLAGQQVDVVGTSQFAGPTGTYKAISDTETNLATQMQENQDTTMDTIQQMEQNIVTNIEQQALQAGARDFLQQALLAPDAMGQQVTVKTPDPLQLNYVYDWSSIFATPSQEGMFVSPYAEGGQVLDTTDKLLKLIGGK